MGDDLHAPYPRSMRAELADRPPPYSPDRLAALTLALPGALFLVAVAALVATGHLGGSAAGGAIAVGALQLGLAAALWVHLPGSRLVAVLLMLVWAGVLVAVVDDRAAPPLLLPAVLAIALLLPLPRTTGARLRTATATHGRGLTIAALLLIAQGVWQAISTVGGLVRSAGNPGIGAALDTAGRAILAAVEVPLELLVYPLAGVFLLGGSWFARRVAIVLEVLTLIGALAGRFATTRAQVSGAMACTVLLLIVLQERKEPRRSR
jgi:hypothetical protein